MKLVMALGLAVALVCLGAEAAGRGENLVPNAGFEQPGVWHDPFNQRDLAIDDAVAHSGTRSLRLSSESTEGREGALVSIMVDPPIRHPFRVSAWSRAQGAEAGQDYSVYLDVFYEDDTALWGQQARFRTGSHDWEQASQVFDVAKPVKRIDVYCLLRKARGTVWFDDVEVTLIPFEFEPFDVRAGLFGGGLGVLGSASLPASWRAAIETPDGVLEKVGGEAGPIRVLLGGPLPPKYTLRVSATDALLGETIHHEQTVTQRAARGAKAQPYAVWTETSMRRVMPTALPPELKGAPKAEIGLAANEHESFQVAVLAGPGAPLDEVLVGCSDLVGKKGAVIPKEQVAWHQVGYVQVRELVQHPAMPHTTPGWWPDALLPVAQFDVAAGFAQAVWVTVHAPAGTTAGDYSGTLTIRPMNADPLKVAVRTKVYGFELPVQGHMKTAFALMDGFLERVYGKPLPRAIRQAYGDYVLRHRLNPDDISRTAVPALDDLLHFRGRGLNTFNVLNMVEERGTRPWVCWSPAETYTPEFKQGLIERLDPYVAALRGHGLSKTAYIYTFDERGEDFYPLIRDYFGMVKKRFPEIHTLTTAKVPQDPAALADLNVDWACPLTSVYDFDAAERCRAAGRQVWAYVCMGPRYPYANILIDHPLIEARVLWWQAYQQKMDGLLYWGLNIWDRPNNDAPIDVTRGPLLEWDVATGGDYEWLLGDGRLLYAGKDGPIGSIRLANIRDGLEDYEYLYRLSELSGDVETGREACLPVTEDLTHYTRDPAALFAQRDAVARKIERLEKAAAR